jgi:hypothetical protein
MNQSSLKEYVIAAMETIENGSSNEHFLQLYNDFYKPLSTSNNLGDIGEHMDDLVVLTSIAYKENIIALGYEPSAVYLSLNGISHNDVRNQRRSNALNIGKNLISKL